MSGCRLVITSGYQDLMENGAGEILGGARRLDRAWRA